MRWRSARCTSILSAGEVCAKTRIVIVCPLIDSTPATVGGSSNRPCQSYSAAIVSVATRMTAETRETSSS